MTLIILRTFVGGDPVLLNAAKLIRVEGRYMEETLPDGQRTRKFKCSEVLHEVGDSTASFRVRETVQEIYTACIGATSK